MAGQPNETDFTLSKSRPLEEPPARPAASSKASILNTGRDANKQFNGSADPSSLCFWRPSYIRACPGRLPDRRKADGEYVPQPNEGWRPTD
jgi:hypothetical protein